MQVGPSQSRHFRGDLDRVPMLCLIGDRAMACFFL